MGTNSRDRRRQKRRRQAAAERARQRRRADAGLVLEHVDASVSGRTLGAITIAGERVDLLAQALLRFKLQPPAPDGMMRFTARIEPEYGDPFVRALRRVEAEMLLEDADLIGTAHDEQRTCDQRAHDALMELIRRIAATFAEVG